MSKGTPHRLADNGLFDGYLPIDPMRIVRNSVGCLVVLGIVLHFGILQPAGRQTTVLPEAVRQTGPVPVTTPSPAAGEYVPPIQVPFPTQQAGAVGLAIAGEGLIALTDPFSAKPNDAIFGLRGTTDPVPAPSAGSTLIASAQVADR